jgi:hypothetical protein
VVDYPVGSIAARRPDLAAANAAAEKLYQPQEHPDKDNPTTSNIRASYAQLLQDGHTLGPDDFHDAYHGAGFPEVPDLKTQLPSNQDLLDHSLEALRRSSMPISPETVHTTRKNVLDHWAATGQLPDINDGPTADAVTRDQPNFGPVHQNISGVIRKLETGGLADPDAAVSSAGAVGRFQILPSTAKSYGFDPARLHEPGYNTMVHNAIIDDLSRRYHGQTDAILVAYNAGPEHADQYIANGRSFAGLGPWTEQTQAYLKRADRLTYGDDLMKPGRDAVYDPMGTLGVKEEGPIAVGGLDLGAIAKAAGIPDLETQHQRVLEHVKQMEEEGASKAEQMTYQGLNDPYGNWFGVGSIGSVTGNLLTKMWYTHAGQAINDLSNEAKEAVQASTRMASGEGRRFIAAGTAALEEFRKPVNKGVPDFTAWLDTKPGQNSPFWQNAPDIMHLIDHMEGGTGGGKLADTSPLKPVADAIRTLMLNTRKMIEAEAAKGNIEIGSFIEDYYRHLWTHPTKADQIFGGGRQGTSASLQKRTIPTIAEGIANGLQPVKLDPIENALHYITGMTNYLMSHRVLQEGIDAGYVKYVGSQSKVPPGWQSLVGRSTTRAWQSGFTSESLEGTEAKIEELKDTLAAKQERLAELQGGAEPAEPRPYGFPTGQIQRAYAPPGYASSYNAVVGKGFYEWPVGGSVYQKLQQASNFMTGMKLGMSGYHAAVIANATVASSIANGLGKLAHFDLVDGMKDIGYGITVLPALARGYTRGRALQKAYLNPPIITTATAPPAPGMIRYYHGTQYKDASGFTGKTFVTPQENYARNYRGGSNNVLYTDIPKAEAIANGLYDAINDFPIMGSLDNGASRLKPLVSTTQTSGDPLMSQLADLYAKVGGRATGRGMEYGYSQAQNWQDAWKRGSLAMELKYGAQRTLGDADTEAAGKRWALAAPRMVSYFGHELARAMAALPGQKQLFDTVIPRIKMSAWADEMEAWMKQNPMADQEAILRQGRKFSDSMDDRFGEMVQDNLFWHRSLKQAFNLSAVSVGWEYGTIRAVGGGIKDLVWNNELSTRARYLLAYPVAFGIMGALYQYFKTGLAGPSVQTPGTDLMTPRTGGTTPEGAPERALLPGEQKEPLRWYSLFQSAPSYEHLLHQTAQYMVGKLNPFWQLMTGIATNRNWAGQPIFSDIKDPEKWDLPSHMGELGNAILEEFLPIGLETGLNLTGQTLKGTNISPAERLMGIRPAPEWIQNPERIQGIQDSVERKEIRQNSRRKSFQQNRQQQ